MRRRFSYRLDDPTPGQVVGLMLAAIVFNLLVIAAIVAVIVLVLRAFGVL